MNPGMYRYIVCPGPDPALTAVMRDNGGGDPPLAFGLFVDIHAAYGRMRELGIRIPVVSVWDRAKSQWAGHLWQLHGITYDSLWPDITILFKQEDGTYKETINVQNSDGTFSSKQ